MEVNILEIVSVLLLVAILLIPVQAALINRQRELRARMAKESEATAPATPRKRVREVPAPRRKLATTELRGAPSALVEEGARHRDITQARAGLRSGAVGLRQAIVMATILAPPRGMSEASTMVPGRKPRPD